MVKDNQPRLKDDIATLWEHAEEPMPPQVEHWNKGHGRVEQRRLWVSEALVGYTDWPYFAQACRIERKRTLRNGKVEQEVSYAITSLASPEADPQRLMDIWRGHWGIENRLHWVRDVTFDEDRSQVRTGAAPQIMAALRNTAIGLLRLAGFPNIAEAGRRCAARPRFALTLLGAGP